MNSIAPPAAAAPLPPAIPAPLPAPAPIPQQEPIFSGHNFFGRGNLFGPRVPALPAAPLPPVAAPLPPAPLPAPAAPLPAPAQVVVEEPELPRAFSYSFGANHFAPANFFQAPPPAQGPAPLPRLESGPIIQQRIEY